MLEGLPPNGATYLMRLECGEATARRVVDIVVETFEPAETAAAAFEVSPDTPDASWSVEVFFGRVPDEASIRYLLEQVAGAQVASQAVFRAIAETDWVATSLAGLEAVREGRFVVHGAHGRSSLMPGDLGIEIEAALAFGTGHHGTTRGCLAMINNVGRRRRPRKVLDIGTGTGVLAIAAARRFRIEVLAGDIDPVAVATAHANALKNGVGAFVRCIRAAGLGHPSLYGSYDLVFANILARPLCALAVPMRQNLARGGELVLSGLLGRDVPSVLSAYRSQGLNLVTRLDIDGWATLLMRRPFSSVAGAPRRA